jgi:predicted cupin superfamily sugar epimerase
MPVAKMDGDADQLAHLAVDWAREPAVTKPIAAEMGAAAEGARTTHRLGPDVLAGETPQGIVPRHAWQMARSIGAFTLVACTVAPGFDFAGFELAPEGFEP